VNKYDSNRTAEKNAKLIKGTPRGMKIKPRSKKEERIPILVPRSKEEIGGRVVSPASSARRDKGPEGGNDPVVFVTYAPQDKPKNTSIAGPYPPDPSGDDTEPGIVLQTGNNYVRYSNDKGAKFQMLANTDVIDNRFAGGQHGDQVMLFVPAIQCFVWYLQYYDVPKSKDGAFRIAFAKLSDLQTKLKGVWSAYDWVSSDFGLPGVGFDYPDIAATDTFLYVTTGTDNQGRIVMRFSLRDLAAGSVGAEYTGLLSIVSQKDKSRDPLRYAHLCQQAQDRGLWAGHVDNSTIRIYEWPDDSGSFNTHDVKTVTWPNNNDYSSKCPGPDFTDWLSNGGDAEISGFVRRQQDELWLAWVASRGNASSTSFKYPNPHVRVATVRMSNWTESAEMQVWNPDYAFAFPDLNVNGAGDVAIGLAFGGPSNFADAAFGIIGDYVVWYENASDKALPRWGDYVTVRRCGRRGNWFAGYGYYTLKDSTFASGAYQKPYYVLFARQSQTP
jgi:hypothetical protein